MAVKIFPLSVPGKIVLILIAIFLGLIWSMFQYPATWKRLLGKKPEEPLIKLPEEKLRQLKEHERKAGK